MAEEESMMLSGVNNHTFISVAIKKYMFKLRAYSGYFCGLVLAQILATTMLLSGSAEFNIGNSNLSITLHTYSAQLAFIFSVFWALVISVLLATQLKKDTTFSFPGNRLTDCFSDFAYILTGCLFGALTVALLSCALRIIIILLCAGHAVVPGFYPIFDHLCTVAAGTGLYMLLASAVGYFIKTTYRINRVIFFVVVAILVVLNFTYFSAASFAAGRSVLAAFWTLLFEQQSLDIFSMTVLLITTILFSLSALMANRMEVKH